MIGVALLLVAGVVVVIGNPALSKPLTSMFAAPPITIVTYPVKTADLIVTVSDKGTLESAKNEDVLSEVEGTTTIIFILPEGSKVKKGDKVCELDAATLRDTLKNQEITTQQATASHEQAKLTREVAEVAVKEYVEGVFKQDFETVQGEIALAKADVTRAQDRLAWSTKMKEKLYISESARLSDELSLKKSQFALEQAQTKKEVLERYTKEKTTKELQAEVEKSKSDELAKSATYELEKSKRDKLVKQIANCLLLAPGDGLVVYANDPGRFGGQNQVQIEEGASVRERQKIFSLPDITQMRVNTKVHESMVERVTKGLRARIRVDAFAGDALNGVVQTIAPMADQNSFFGSDIKVYTTLIAIENGPTGLRPGMSAMVEILVSQIPNVLSVPVQAIIEMNGKNYLYVKNALGTFDRRAITTGTSNDQLMEIKTGLKSGDEVAMTPALLMTDDDKREFGGNSKDATKKDWGHDAKGAPVAGAGVGADPAKAAPAVGPDGAPAKAKAKGKGAGRPAFMSKITPEIRAQMRDATEAERSDILKKAGLTDDEIEQMKQMRANRPPGGGGPGGGGGFGGGQGGGPSQ